MNAMNNALRIFFCIEKVGKIPHIGSTGFKYSTPVLTTQHLILRAADYGKIYDDKTRAPLTSGKVAGCGYRYFSSVSVKDVIKSDEARGAPKKKPKTLESPKIKLISETQVITVVTLEEAGKIAARKGLHLIPVSEKKDQTIEKPTYRLVTNAEFLKLDNENTPLRTDVTSNEKEHDWGSNKDEKKKVKDVKSVMFKSKIAEHDALSKINQMKKWIEKGHSVRVVIGQTGDKGDSESIYKMLEKELKDSGARFLQKVAKADQIRVQVVPPKEPKVPKTKELDHEGISESR